MFHGFSTALAPHDICLLKTTEPLFPLAISLSMSTSSSFASSYFFRPFSAHLNSFRVPSFIFFAFRVISRVSPTRSIMIFSPVVSFSMKLHHFLLNTTVFASSFMALTAANGFFTSLSRKIIPHCFPFSSISKTASPYSSIFVPFAAASLGFLSNFLLSTPCFRLGQTLLAAPLSTVTLTTPSFASSLTAAVSSSSSSTAPTCNSLNLFLTVNPDLVGIYASSVLSIGLLDSSITQHSSTQPC